MKEKTDTAVKTTWEILSNINCNDKTETVQKQGVKLTYLSRAWAWGIVKSQMPDANYEIVHYDGKPYLFDDNLGYMVSTKVTISGETIPMCLPVMDSKNKAMKANVYTYDTKNYKGLEVAPASMFDINTAIMRCLTKNLAMFGLGHYIYAGEDLPTSLDDNDKDIKPKADKHKEPQKPAEKSTMTQRFADEKIIPFIGDRRKTYNECIIYAESKMIISDDIKEYIKSKFTK